MWLIIFQAMAVSDMLVLGVSTIVGVYPDICRVSTDFTGPCRTFIQQVLPWLWAYVWPFAPMGQVASV